MMTKNANAIGHTWNTNAQLELASNVRSCCSESRDYFLETEDSPHGIHQRIPSVPAGEEKRRERNSDEIHYWPHKTPNQSVVVLL